MLAIEAAGLTKQFKGSIRAVDGVDLEVHPGEIFAFLGPNGAGKTTIVRMMTTLLKPTTGRALIAGIDTSKDPRLVRRTIGVALQEAGLDAMATGRELLELQAKLHGLDGTSAKKRASEVLDLMGLEGAADRLVKTYSGGMKRRLDLGSALMHGPQILFLDEPTEGLDPASRQTVWDEVCRLNKEQGITIFLTTHYLEEADRLADRIAIIDMGKIVAEGTPHSLKERIGSDIVTLGLAPADVALAQAIVKGSEGVKDVRAGADEIVVFVTDGGNSAARILRDLDAAGITAGSINLSSPTLDEVFLRTTGSRVEGTEHEAAGTVR